jgi:hypothetical protein
MFEYPNGSHEPCKLYRFRLRTSRFSNWQSCFFYEGWGSNVGPKVSCIQWNLFQYSFALVIKCCYQFFSQCTGIAQSVRDSLDGPRMESRWGRDFALPSRPALGTTQPSIQWVTRLFTGRVKRPERGLSHPPSSSAEVKERVELYLYSPCGPSWPVVGWTLHLPIFLSHLCNALWKITLPVETITVFGWKGVVK